MGLVNRSVIRRSVENALTGGLRDLAVRATTKSPWRDYNDFYKCVFVPIPRTGGTSISHSLFGNEFGHPPLYHFYAYDKRRTEDYFKFAFVRNPWDRLVSTFFFLKAGARGGRALAWSREYISVFNEFNDFVLALRRARFRNNVVSFALFRPQWEFICLNGELSTNFCGRFETLSIDFHHVCTRLGKNVDLMTCGQSIHRPYSEHYSPAAKEIVEDIYRRDIELFSYEF